MKKLAVLALLVILGLNPSQAKMTSVERVMAYQKRSVLLSQMQTKNVLARVIPHYKRQALGIDLEIDDDDRTCITEEIDIYVAYRRPEFDDEPLIDDEELSDYVTVRLAVARARAMAAYQKIHT